MTLLPGAVIPIDTVPNLRDLGGYPTAEGGVVRHGLLYRSVELSRLAGPSLAEFGALGIHTVYDLRGEHERLSHPDVLPPAARGVVIDVMADSLGAAPTQLVAVRNDPVAASETLGGGKGVEIFARGYREFVTLPSALAGYSRLLKDIAGEPDDRHDDHPVLPALFHCTTGKDRTGWAAAVLLLLLGVSPDDVRSDYLLTNEYLLPTFKDMLAGFAAKGGDPEVLLPVLGVREEYLEASLAEATAVFGSFDGYVRDGLGLDETTVARLRRLLVEY